MRFLLSLFLAATFGMATTIVSYNVYERSERVDIMLSFDAPFDQPISMQKGEGYISVALNGLGFNDTADRVFSDGILSGIKIYPSNGNTYIVAATDRDVKVLASKTANDFGLRVRFVPDLPPLAKSPSPLGKPTETETQTDLFKTDTIDLNTYLIVLVVLSFLVAVLYFVKRKVTSITPNNAGKGNSWLFSKLQTQEGIQVLAQKQLDVKNRVVLFETHGMRYLVVVGTNNVVLLDKQTATGEQSQSQFDTILNENTRQLDHYMGQKSTSSLENYKTKASGEHSFLA